MKSRSSVVHVNGNRYICLAELMLLTPSGDEKPYYTPCYFDKLTFKDVSEVMADAIATLSGAKRCHLYKVVTRLERGVEIEDYEEVLLNEGELHHGK